MCPDPSRAVNQEMVEAAGIEPASQGRSVRASTRVAYRLISPRGRRQAGCRPASPRMFLAGRARRRRLSGQPARVAPRVPRARFRRDVAAYAAIANLESAVECVARCFARPPGTSARRVGPHAPGRNLFAPILLPGRYVRLCRGPTNEPGRKPTTTPYHVDRCRASDPVPGLRLIPGGFRSTVSGATVMA